MSSSSINNSNTIIGINHRNWPCSYKTEILKWNEQESSKNSTQRINIIEIQLLLEKTEEAQVAHCMTTVKNRLKICWDRDKITLPKL